MQHYDLLVDQIDELTKSVRALRDRFAHNPEIQDETASLLMQLALIRINLTSDPV